MRTPSKNNNQFLIDCAYPGLCSYCHSEIAYFNGSREVAAGVFRPIITMLKPNYRESLFRLSDGTKMVVALCEECDDDIEPKHMNELMESEINGWQKEVSELMPSHDEKVKTDYIEDQAKKFIDNRLNRPWTLGQLSKLTKPRPEKLSVKTKKEKVK